MARRTDFQAATTYTGQRINKPCVVSLKIDGCRVLYRDGKFVSRNDKPYPGLDAALTPEAKDKIKEFGDCEIFAGNFKKTSGTLQQHHPAPNTITATNIYPLSKLDRRLVLVEVLDPKPYYIEMLMEAAVELEFEGLVIRTDTHWYRVKPHATADVYITGFFEQHDKDKNPKGQLGGFDTNFGKVTAFSDEMRQKLWDNPKQYVGSMITVQYKERYHTGKFRYAVKFLDFRYDKDEESFDTEPPES